MTQTEILQFMNANQACHLATVEGDQPRVRGMLIYRADEQGILFHTGTSKDVYKQLIGNPRVEFCFNNLKDGTQVRVSGEAKPVEDQRLKEEIVANRPFMKAIINQYGYKVIALFRVQDLVATVWTMATNLEPKVSIRLC